MYQHGVSYEVSQWNNNISLFKKKKERKEIKKKEKKERKKNPTTFTDNAINRKDFKLLSVSFSKSLH